MNIIDLKERQNISNNIKLKGIYAQLGELLKELKTKKMSPKIVKSINEHIEQLNSTFRTGNQLMRLIKQKQTTIMKLVEKEFKIVPKNYYLYHWSSVGILAFGLPIGVAIGFATDNVGLIAIGLPFGMFIGRIIGFTMDKKAYKEGRQLEITLKY